MVSSLAVALVGPGLVGSAVISQVLASSRSNVRLVAVSNSRCSVYSANGAGFSAFDKDLVFKPEASLDPAVYSRYATDFVHLVKYLKSLDSPSVIVDCSSSSLIPSQLYIQAVKQGISIVTPNKKGFSDSYSFYTQLILAKSDYFLNTGKSVGVLHESTVGAGLPILSTLQDLIDTGDNVIRIEGILSGTLSYIFNEWGSSTDMKFSKVVTIAKNLGYTEPDPRDDLNGVDFARKVVILARLLGLSVELSDVPVEQIINIDTSLTIDQFMETISAQDERLHKLRASYHEKNEYPRYVGEIDLVNKSVSVKLSGYPKTHAFCGLKGSDNVISFTTDRFKSEQPLIIRGPGAGDAVTAFGVYSDILKVARAVGSINL